MPYDVRSVDEPARPAPPAAWLRPPPRSSASYFALCGDGGARGDGITPLAGALLEGEGVRHVVLDGDGAEQRDGAGVYHADFLPSPGPSTRLRGTPWYGSPGALDAWLPLLQEPDGAGGKS